MNRVSGFEPDGRRFESCWRRQRGCPDRAGAARADAQPVGIGKEVGSTPTIGSMFFHITNTHHQFGARAGRRGLSAQNRERASRPQRSMRSVPPTTTLRPGACTRRAATGALVMRHDRKRAGSPGPAAVGYLENSGSIPAPGGLEPAGFPWRSFCPGSAMRATCRTRPHRHRRSRVRRAGVRGLSTSNRLHPWARFVRW